MPSSFAKHNQTRISLSGTALVLCVLHLVMVAATAMGAVSMSARSWTGAYFSVPAAQDTNLEETTFPAYLWTIATLIPVRGSACNAQVALNAFALGVTCWMKMV